MIASSDQRIGYLTDLIGDYSLPLRTDYFASLLRAIVGQQLSVKAAKSIWNRTVQACGGATPEAVLSLDEETLRSDGCPGKKSFTSGICPKRWSRGKSKSAIKEL